MKLDVAAARPADVKTDALVCALTEKPKALPRPLADLDRALDGLVRDALGSGELTGKRNKVVSFHTAGRLPARKLICVGLGPADKVTLEHARRAVAVAAKAARSQNAKTMAVAADTFGVKRTPRPEIAGALAEGILLSQYKFDRFKKKNEEAKALTSATLLVPGQHVRACRKAVGYASIVAEAASGARDLVNMPGNELKPETLARTARELTRAHGLTCRVLQGKQLETEKLAGVLAVGAGSNNSPRFIIVEYRPTKGKGKPLVLVGKGVTFDSGGLSLKGQQYIVNMKSDMGGAAAALYAMTVVAQLKPAFPVIALLPAVENMPSGTASRPDDIIRYASGQTVEIISTDAEGRLILADALLWAKRYKPAAVVDLATLTGACVIALGEHAIGLCSTDSKLARRITKAGEATFERVWPLPLWEEYEPQLDSEVADMKNIGGRPAGTITAALFLKRFVQGTGTHPAYPWAHLDIAGCATTDKERPYTPKGATGIGVRLLAHLISNWTA
jgi:leucyl aminopeptidase